LSPLFLIPFNFLIFLIAYPTNEIYPKVGIYHFSSLSSRSFYGTEWFCDTREQILHVIPRLHVSTSSSLRRKQCLFFRGGSILWYSQKWRRFWPNLAACQPKMKVIF
jgi:hypothetical protein